MKTTFSPEGDDTSLGSSVHPLTLPPQPYHTTFRTQSDRLVEDTLCKMIRDHGFPCRLEADGMIRAAMYCSYVRIEDIKDTGKRGFWQIDTVKPTLSAVREWLGY
jgi:hypothetical protein